MSFLLVCSFLFSLVAKELIRDKLNKLQRSGVVALVTQAPPGVSTPVQVPGRADMNQLFGLRNVPP